MQKVKKLINQTIFFNVNKIIDLSKNTKLKWIAIGKKRIYNEKC